MHTLNVAEDKTAALNTVLDCVEKSFQSADEQAAFSIYDGVANLNPLFDFFYSREYTAASTSMAKKLQARQDPRLHRVYADAIGADKTLGNAYYCKQLDGTETNLGADNKQTFMGMMAPNGGDNLRQKQEYYNTSIFLMAATAPTYLMSYHELLFLKAEALVRLESSDAEQALKEAVVAGMLNTEENVQNALSNTVVPVKANSTTALTAADAEEYFDLQVKPLFDADALQETMIQKYIALWGANGESTENYNDVRRLKAEGYDFYQLENPGRFPLRAPYGSDEVSANPNVGEAYGNGQYVFSEPVWWAGGNR